MTGDVEAAEAGTDPDPAGLERLATNTEQAQASARWLIGAFAALGTLLVPGLGIAGIGDLEGWRLAAAVVAVAVALIAAILTVAAFVRFVRAGRTELSELAERERSFTDDPLIAYLHRNAGLFQGHATNVEELRQRYIEAHERLADAQQRASAEGPTPGADRVAEAQAILTRLTEVAESIEATARLAGPGDLVLADLANAEKDAAGDKRARLALEYFTSHPEVFEGEAESFHHLRTKLLTARTELVAAKSAAPERKALETAGCKKLATEESVEIAETRVDILNEPIVQIESVAALQDLHQTFERRRLRVALGPLIVAIAMAVFVVAANEPLPDRSDLSGQTIQRIDLSGTKLEKADLSGTTFKDSNLTGADLDGADLAGTRFIGTRCPDGKSSEAEGVGRACKGHLRPPVVRPPRIRPTGSVEPPGGIGGRG